MNNSFFGRFPAVLTLKQLITTNMNNTDLFYALPDADSKDRFYFSTSIQWKIASLKERILDAEEGSITSPVFECSDSSWQLVIRPNQYKDMASYANHEFQLDVKKIRSGSESNVITYYSFRVSGEEGKHLDKYSSSVSEMRDKPDTHCVPFIKSCGATSQGGPPTTAPSQPSDFMQSKPNSSFSFGAEQKASEIFGIQNVSTRNQTVKFSLDTFTIFFTIFVEKIHIPCSPFNKITTASVESVKDGQKKSFILSPASNLSFDFENLYKDPQFSDVTLKLGEEEFQAHKLMLRSRSRVFAAMFEHMKENQEDAVDLVQMEVETVRDMLRYIYCGKVDELSPEQALNLYVAADRYDLQELKFICREFLLCDISINNVCDIAVVGDLHSDESLIDAVKSFLIKNGREIIKTEKWKALSVSKSVVCTKMFEWAFS